jgi:anti-anti-sigma factor
MMIKMPATISAREARSFSREVRTGLAAERTCIVADFSAVRDMDSAALNILTACMERIADKDGSLHLAGISPEAATIFELAGLDRVFDIFQAGPVLVPDYEMGREPADEAVPEVVEQASLQPSAA